MARLSFEKRRAPQLAEQPAVPVRVFGTGTASVGGTPVVAAPGEEIQQAVLNHLQRLAISLGAPIRATVQDDLAGCVVPLEVATDGSSRMTGEPVPMTAPGERVPMTAPGERVPMTASEEPAGLAAASAPGTVQTPAGRFGPAPLMDVPVRNPDSRAGATDPPADPHATGVAPNAGTRAGARDARTDAREARTDARAGGTAVPAQAHAREPAAPRTSAAGRAVGAVPADMFTALASDVPAVATHTPARGFDAVAEEVLGDGPLTETAEGAELLSEPMGRISEAVRAGRVEAAAELADRTLVEASAVFGPRHAEVLRLRELAAYIAYLGDDPVRACRLSVDVALLRRQTGDGDAAYGNVRSAATAWRAVRDPEEGLRLGRDLIGLWTDLAAEPGAAADDVRPLEAARARMVRLTDRAAEAAQA
ncbi:tetratricopeptide repeat protein [Streptomyces sp. SID486]|uniref:tetratricopeptide repeat protein n=1 Tax=Streptomyces sp. SID486 TaxID=2690264 RepID=UPI00136CD0B0|nr:tetratricopeptide repeat protein [Streptomyces sp. SID486]MYX99405.1 tetratricopeptide repeat protein [Streptomyces sp. SID486]